MSQAAKAGAEWLVVIKTGQMMVKNWLLDKWIYSWLIMVVKMMVVMVLP